MSDLSYPRDDVNCGSKKCIKPHFKIESVQENLYQSKKRTKMTLENKKKTHLEIENVQELLH